MATESIQFGTSGWRAVIAEEFTFDNVQLAVRAIGEYVKSKSRTPTLLVGYDTRFLSEDFAQTAAEVLQAHGIRVLLCAGPTPTPAVAYEILRRKTDGAINFTASHNPAEYHGLKFSAADGGPALPEVTRAIEARIARLRARSSGSRLRAQRGSPSRFRPGRGRAIETIDPRSAYLARLGEIVNFASLRAAKLKIACDFLHGCGAGYLDRVLADQGVEVIAIRADRDVLFGGHGPDVSAANLAPLGKALLECEAQVGLATDGDADRFGILDADGSFVAPNHVLALLFDYLVETRRWQLGAARSVATTHFVDAVARQRGLPTFQTPVGFKYIGELIKQDKITLGGEESAGLSIRGHVPEKDGVLACLLVAEMIATRRAPLDAQLRALFARVGAEYWPLRVNLQLAEEVKTRVVARLQEDFDQFLGGRVTVTDRTDGVKLIFEDGSWVLLRLSGTEPLLRLYTEAASPAAANQLAEETKRWIFE
jgi:alpha-D-glucose phosphate-specific phosphoglucomutase